MAGFRVKLMEINSNLFSMDKQKKKVQIFPQNLARLFFQNRAPRLESRVVFHREHANDDLE